MPFQPIAPPNLAAAAAAQMRELIAIDVLRPGDALPGERDLAVRMGISRTSLREALQVLSSEGLLVSKHGSGLRVSEEIGGTIVNPLITLLESTPNAVFDYLAFRKMFEGEAAATVAKNATDAELAEIDRIVEEMAGAHGTGDQEREIALDAEFHMAIIEATGNVVTIQIARSLHELLRRGVKHHHKLVYGDETAHSALMEQHAAINTAIQRRKTEDARNTMHAHLDFLAETMRAKAEEERRGRIVGKRRAWAQDKA